MGIILIVRQKEKQQTNKQTKQTKAQQKRSPIFRKLRVASAFSFETKKGKCLGHAYRAFSELTDSVIHVPKELSGFVYTLHIHCDSLGIVLCLR